VLRRTVLAAAAIVSVVFAAGTFYLLTLPSASDAMQRTRRILVAHDEMTSPLPAPARLVDAVVATEDEHFYDNIVINVLTGAGRAALAALHTSEDPGGSTIQQQLAKALYGRGSGAFGTLREIGLGVKLALAYSRLDILRMYLNANYYGQGFWGVRAAAKGYFRTEPGRLSWGEAAMLGGLLQAPSAYDPLVHLALARSRQRHVLAQLVANGDLTASAERAATTRPSRSGAPSFVEEPQPRAGLAAREGEAGGGGVERELERLALISHHVQETSFVLHADDDGADHRGQVHDRDTPARIGHRPLAHRRR
jgi:penicillin-binding protein 1A